MGYFGDIVANYFGLLGFPGRGRCSGTLAQRHLLKTRVTTQQCRSPRHLYLGTLDQTLLVATPG